VCSSDLFPFRYFVDEFGLKYFAAFPGCSTETEASAATVAFLIDKVKAERIPVVFYREFSNEAIADAISEATGAVPLLMHSCHNVTREDFERGVGYLELMSANVEVLRKALD
jgi:zinc transport system substrate-binding protein